MVCRPYHTVARVWATVSKRSFRRDFRALWVCNATEQEFFALAQKVSPAITWAQFDRGWQWRTVLNAHFDTAVSEFAQVLIGCI